MFLARAEIRRSRGKFLMLTAAVGLLAYLILVQQAIAGALVTSFNGAIANQNAPVLVYATDALASPQGSIITPDNESLIADDPSVANSARVGILSAAATLADHAGEASSSGTADETDETNESAGETTVTIWGAEDPALGGPAEPVEGEAVAADGEALGTRGDVSVGETVTISGEEEDLTFTVVGLVEDAQVNVTPTLYVSYADYEAAVATLNPFAQGVLPSLIAVEPASSAEETISALTEASAAIEPLTREAAAEDFPGVGPVNTSFLIILGLFGFVVPLVTGLFFLILTFQKSKALTLLRAVGARSGVLVRSLMIQVVLVLGVGLAIGTALYAITTQFVIGGLRLSFSWETVALWSGILLVLGVLSALASVRRVLAVEPVEATRGGH
ncbi:MAG TPA: ABC transporter permease [Actinomycetales bacterium]|nr:ABC transporter permease [Actinomycetales bacterium]